MGKWLARLAALDGVTTEPADDNKVSAERRLGEMLAGQKADGGLKPAATLKRGPVVASDDHGERPKLAAVPEAEKICGTPSVTNPQMPQKMLLCVLRAQPQGGAADFYADDLGNAKAVVQCEDLDDEAKARLYDRRDRLIAWGHSADEAEALALRLAARDSDGDDRRLCIECRHLERGGRCAQARAGRMLPECGRNFEPPRTLLQRCPRFEPRGRS